MSKHKQRWERRAKYREMLRGELADEPAFIRRIRTILFSKDGRDFAPDGRGIKGDLFGAIEEWEQKDPQSARACLNLIETVVHPESAHSCVSFIGRDKFLNSKPSRDQ